VVGILLTCRQWKSFDSESFVNRFVLCKVALKDEGIGG